MIANANFLLTSTQKRDRINRSTNIAPQSILTHASDRQLAPLTIKRRFQLDRQAFEEYAGKLTPKLLSVARRFLRNEEDAADVVQDTFLSALKSIDKFKGESSVYTWLYRILVNLCLMNLRSSTRSKCVSFEFISELCDRRELREPVTSLANLPEALLESVFLVKQVRDCINRLPADYRNIILLRDIEQFDTDDTSRLLRVSRGVVKTRLHRARRALRAMVEKVIGNPYETQQAICNLD